MTHLSSKTFKLLVTKAISNLSDESQKHLENIQVVVDLYPSEDQLLGTGLENKLSLLSLYEGIPLADRYGYEKILPDKITLFQESLESISIIENELIKEIQITISLELSRQLELPQD